MADNKLEGLRDAEGRASTDGDTMTTSDPAAPPLTGAELDASQPDADKAKPAEQTDAIVTEMEPEKDAAAADKANQTVDAAAVGGVSLNAGSADNKGQAPDLTSQATGHSPSKSFPAPTPTRDSAIHQLDMKIAELAYFLNDFGHKVDDRRQALIDAVRNY